MTNSPKTAAPQSVLDARIKDLESRMRVQGGFHPVRSVVLFASGCRLKVLALVPSEEPWFSVLGSLVILTSLFAATGAFVSVGYWTEGAISLSLLALLVALAWGIAIFWFDRAIAKLPLNQVRFSADVLEMLANPQSDTQWYEIATGRRVNAYRRTFGQFIGVLAVAAPRIIVAVATSFIFAESLVMVIYEKDIQPRVEYIKTEIAEQNAAGAAELLQTQTKAINAQLDTLAGALTPDLPDLQGKLDAETDVLKALESDQLLVGQLLGFEANGIKTSLTLSDGTTLETTGNPTYGSNYAELQIVSFRLQRRIDESNRSIEDYELKIASLRDLLDGNPQVIQLREQLANLSSTKPVDPNPDLLTGLGVRQEALAAFEQDTLPATVEPDPAPPCTDVLCTVTQAIIYPSPAGLRVAAFRWTFFFIELMPVLTKLAFVLRRRRPYDSLIAAVELVHEGATLRTASGELVRMGAQMEVDSAGRRGMRASAAARADLARMRFTNQVRRWRAQLRNRENWGSSVWNFFSGKNVEDDDEYPKPPTPGTASERPRNGDNA